MLTDGAHPEHHFQVALWLSHGALDGGSPEDILRKMFGVTVDKSYGQAPSIGEWPAGEGAILNATAIAGLRPDDIRHLMDDLVEQLEAALAPGHAALLAVWPPPVLWNPTPGFWGVPPMAQAVLCSTVRETVKLERFWDRLRADPGVLEGTERAVQSLGEAWAAACKADAAPAWRAWHVEKRLDNTVCEAHRATRRTARF